MEITAVGPLLPMTSVGIWCFAFGSYLLFAGTISLSELLTGFVAAMLAAFWALLIRASSRHRFEARREQIPPVLRASVGIFPATLRTAAVLGKVAVSGGSPSRSMRSRFRPGPSEDPREQSRRAIAVLCASLAPNRFVVNAERRRGEALLHSIDRSNSELDPEWLQ